MSMPQKKAMNYMIKRIFWSEFAHADKTGTKVNVKRMLTGVSMQTTFYCKIQNSQAYIPWLLTPIVEYNNVINGFLDKAKDRYEDLISMPIYKFRNGEITDDVDPKKAAVLLAVIKNLEDRGLGSALQRQVSISTTEPSSKIDESTQLDRESIDKRLMELELQLGEQTYESNQEYIDAEVISDGSQIQRIDEVKEELPAEND